MTLSASPKPVENLATEVTENTAPASLSRVLVALDASDHANRALDEAVRLAKSAEGTITGIHAYAAQLHDRRFKMMEGGLPERYLEEEEMEYQREVHDDLISRGLGIITDSYHDVGGEVCKKAGVGFKRLSPEGKNYTKVVEAARSGKFDLLVLGALGLGAVPGGLVGTVCERVVRRSPIDTLVIRNPEKAICDGPIVVGIDGSDLSYGGLMTALDIAARVNAEVHAVAAYDPYYHYVAFNKIAGVLSEEAGKVFRFKEQEQLHEELIDDGIAKIYQSHLDVAKTVAEDLGVKLTTKLLDGKPYSAIVKYLDAVNASLVVLGKTGIHADDELDIGGNAENLLRLAPCHVWLGATTYTPPLDVVAEECVSWSVEAEKKLSMAPEFVRGMARRMVLRQAQKAGHTFITAGIVDEVMQSAMPGFSKGGVDASQTIEWSDAAAKLLETVSDDAVTDNIRLRAIKRARREKAGTVMARHVRPFLDLAVEDGPAWSAAALARVSRVPAMVRDKVKMDIEDMARERDMKEVPLELAEEGVAEIRKSMCPVPLSDDTMETVETDGDEAAAASLEWTPAAEERLSRVPEGFMRDMTRKRIEAFAERNKIESITPGLMEEKYGEWAKGSAKRKQELEWDDSAAQRVGRIPEFIRGMVILEIERCAREKGNERVTEEVINEASGVWEKMGAFHSESAPDLSKN